MLAGVAYRQEMAGEADPVPPPGTGPGEQFVLTARVVTELYPYPYLDPVTVAAPEPLPFLQVCTEILFGKPGPVVVGDACLEVLEKDHLLEAASQRSLHIFFHFAGGMPAESGVDMAVTAGVHHWLHSGHHAPLSASLHQRGDSGW